MKGVSPAKSPAKKPQTPARKPSPQKSERLSRSKTVAQSKKIEKVVPAAKTQVRASSPKKSVTIKASPAKKSSEKKAPVVNFERRASRSQAKESPKKTNSSARNSLSKSKTSVKPETKDKKMVSPAKKLQRSVTVQKRKDSPKKSLTRSRPSVGRSKSKSPVKSMPMRKRDVKAAQKTEVKLAKTKTLVAAVTRVQRSKSVAPSRFTKVESLTTKGAVAKKSVSPPKQQTKKASADKKR